MSESTETSRLREAGPAARPPLRVGILVDRMEQPAWVCRILRELSEAEYATIALVIRNRDVPGRGTKGTPGGEPAGGPDAGTSSDRSGRRQG